MNKTIIDMMMTNEILLKNCSYTFKMPRPMVCLTSNLRMFHDSIKLSKKIFKTLMLTHNVPGRARGYSFKLFKRRYRLNVGQFKFANLVCEEWNRWDDDVVAVGSVNAFKRKLDHHLRNMRGYF